MDNLNLLQDEVVIFHNQEAREVKADTTIDLYLTSHNVIVCKTVKKGLLKKEKVVEKYPLEQILVSGGRPQIAETIPDEDTDDFYEGSIKIEFTSGAYIFELNEDGEDEAKKAAKQWVNCVNILLTGLPYGNNSKGLGVGNENQPDNSAYAAYYFYQKIWKR
ncbi:MAG: hypothetical protein IJB02_02950 [Oscillospiraceae bacterium]|nr:hypothetical protein [Oscillospiraceae bacterium]